MEIESLVSPESLSWSLKNITVKGSESSFWDEGYGDIYIYRETMGIVGFVRALNWEEAYECLTDEIMPDAPPFEEWDQEEQDAYKRDGTLPEGYHHRGGTPSNKQLKEPIAAEDLNGSSLDKLTPKMMADWDIVVTWEGE
jgi:hypothetical protein